MRGHQPPGRTSGIGVASFAITLAAALSSLVVAACGAGQSGMSGTGGNAGTGGTSASGGAAPGIGGATSTGGRTESGGATGTGGVTAGSGGNGAGSGGASPGTGGAPGSGGATGTGGSGGGSATGGHSGTSGGTGGNSGLAGSGAAGHAGSGGTDSGGAGGSNSYAPCPTNGDPCKILPFGDSITHGHASSDDGGYRTQLFKLIVAANQKVTFNGSLTNGPAQVSGQTFPSHHEGHDGWTIDPGYSTYGSGGISSLVPSPAFDDKPHIVLLHIGTNDTGFMDSANMSTRLESLLDKVAQASPSSLIVLAQLTPLGYANAARTTYNAKIPGIVQAHAAKGQHIVGVDMSKMPVADIGSDSVHPNDQGYAYMATVWYAALKNLLPM